MPTDTERSQEQTDRIAVTPPGPGLSGPEMAHLAAMLSERIGGREAPCVVLDMRNVDFIDSSALGALVIFRQELEHASGRVVLTRCHDNIASLFKLTRLDTIIAVTRGDSITAQAS